jgi:hypothetical protein
MTSSGIEFEQANIVPPLVGFPTDPGPPVVVGMLNQLPLVATTPSQVVNLLDIFDCSSDGDDHFFTLCADGEKVYFALGSDALGEIDETAVYDGDLDDAAKFCWPVPDGQQFHFNLKSVRGYHYLYYKLPAGSSVSPAYFRVARTSLKPDNTPATQFKAIVP